MADWVDNYYEWLVLPFPSSPMENYKGLRPGSVLMSQALWDSIVEHECRVFRNLDAVGEVIDG